MGACLTLAATLGTAALQTVFVPVAHFTLCWMHAIKKVRWEEDYSVAADADRGQPPVLQVLQARARARARGRGFAAGIEQPPDARLRNGWYEYTQHFARPLE